MLEARGDGSSQATLFFIAAVATQVGWTAVSSQLGRLALAFGPSVLLHCSLAYFLPALPLVLAQLLWDERYDRKYGQQRAGCWRACAGFGSCALVAAIYPFRPETTLWLLSSVAALGICSVIAFNATYQLAAQQGSSQGAAVVALSLGYVCSGPIVLAVEAVLQLGPSCSWVQVTALYETVAALSAAGLAAHLLAQWHIWRQLQQQQQQQPVAEGEEVHGEWREGAPAMRLAPQRPHARLGNIEEGSAATEPLLGSAGKDAEQRTAHLQPGSSSRGSPRSLAGATVSQQLQPQQESAAASALLLEAAAVEQPVRARPELDSSGSAAWVGELTGAEEGEWIEMGRGAEGAPLSGPVLRRMWRAAAALALSVGSSMALFPLFTFVPSSGWLGMMLPQVLFWARIFADSGARLLPRCLPATSPTRLLLLAATKLALAPLLLLYIQGRLPLLRALGPAAGDAAATAFVVVQWLLSGYINTSCYLAAPRLVPPGLGPRAGRVLSLVFQFACLAGLLAAVPLKRWAVPPS